MRNETLLFYVAHQAIGVRILRDAQDGFQGLCPAPDTYQLALPVQRLQIPAQCDLRHIWQLLLKAGQGDTPFPPDDVKNDFFANITFQSISLPFLLLSVACENC